MEASPLKITASNRSLFGLSPGSGSFYICFNPAMSVPLLRMQNISKSFGGVKALDNAELTLRAGEVHALMGENGAGKSTLIKVLTGVYTPDSGTIELDGKRINASSPREAEACGISTVYQEINLVPTLSIADNILLGRQPTRLGFLRKKAMRRRAEAALARLGLKLDVTRPLASCSMAIQQMVAIARALDIKAKLLILDEPTSSLDEQEVAFLFAILRRLKQEGMALLFVTHFLDQVYAVSDCITVLRNGKFVGEYRASDLPRIQLISAMLGRNFEEMQHLREETTSAEGEKKELFLSAKGLGRTGLMKPLDLNIARGEVLGLAGLLGSGRTETAKMIFGVYPPSSGGLTIEGKNANLSSPRRAIDQGLAFCSEDRKTEGIVPHLSVRENLILAMQASRGALHLLSRKEQETLADALHPGAEYQDASAETPIMHLSGGNQQKVLLARWLALQPS